ncbi:MAG: hypothetical protein FH748_01010 [Balneolaceae bacterium]|nr:hypothetical protein [Balneolaceae bacterium]
MKEISHQFKLDTSVMTQNLSIKSLSYIFSLLLLLLTCIVTLSACSNSKSTLSQEELTNTPFGFTNPRLTLFTNTLVTHSNIGEVYGTANNALFLNAEQYGIFKISPQ